MKPLLYLSIAVMVMASCNNMNNAGGNADLAKDKATFQRFYSDMVNKHNADLMDTLFSSDFIDHSPDPGYGTTRADLKKDFANFFKGFPDVHATINVLSADSNIVTVEATWTGTNTGPMIGGNDSSMPATNKKINIEGIDMVRIKDGKITEHWGYYDDYKMFHQLGLWPGMAKDSSKTGS